MNLEVYFVDSFTKKVFSGNAAGVVFHSGELTASTMQNIAFENNLSETAFVDTNKSNEIKFYSPEVEVDLCGHATLASAFVYFNFINEEANEIIFNSNRGKLVATRKDDAIVMSLPKDQPERESDLDMFIDALGCDVKEAYKGIDDYLAILKDEDTVKNLIPDIDKIAKMPSRGLIVSAKGKEVDFVSRVFGPNVGVDEDPVTGSAHALLATYWASILGKNDLTARQLSKREGSLYCSVKEDTVEITGHAVLYLRGTIEV
tara:strand:+ start:239 stop:1018 length:780 start_codon:yes stop_codon:yes gene_type:complete